MLYWTALDAPDAYVARQLHLDGAEIVAMRHALAKMFEVRSEDLASLPFTLSNGSWPRSSVPWDKRHAGHLIATGLDRPDDDILVYVAGEGALNVGEVRALTNQIRAGLRAEGVTKNTWIALDSTQRVESFLLAIALLLEGAVIVRLGDNIGPDTMTGMLQVAPVQMTFTAHDKVLANQPSAGKIVSLDPDSAGLTFADWVDAFAAHAGSDLKHVDLAPDDIALIGFTSGSTGVPKVVRNTHQAIWRSTEVAARLFDLNADDVFMTATDFVALSGFRSMLSLPLFTGGKVVFPSAEARVTPLAQALECEQYGVTCLTAVPNVLRGFLKVADRFPAGPLATLRTVMSGSGVLDAPTATAFHDRFTTTIIDYYGKRETATNIYATSDRATTMSTQGGRAAETLIRILDHNDDPVGPDQPGEIVIFTDCGQARAAAGADDLTTHPGWHRTGDFGKVTDEGQIIITGRKSDIIKTPDGQLLSPIEVENILSDDTRVMEALVFPFKRTDAVERVGAAVLCSPDTKDADLPGLEEALQWKVRHALGAYKTPDRILILHTFPRAGRDKPDRTTLIAAFQAAFVPGPL
jgi:acyl-coenzyme A synthetase/AMP-(fatty) acid ligase